MAPPTSSAALTWLKVYGRMFILFVQALVTAAGVATVEEFLFRSWLPDEIAADLGYYRGIIISGLAFALFQRCTSFLMWQCIQAFDSDVCSLSF